MSLRFHYELGHETIQDLELAAEQRYKDALVLMASGNWDACIYLAGYCVEMWLKAAYFLLDGVHPEDEVVGRLRPSRTKGQLLGLPSDESYHSLSFWSALLIHERGRLPSSSPGLDKEIRLRSGSLYSIWWVEMRYRLVCATRSDAMEALDHVL